MLDFLQVTTQYTNAVLLAILPQISQVCHELGVPITTPVTTQQVARFNCSYDKTGARGTVILTNDCLFGFLDGRMDLFRDLNSLSCKRHHTWTSDFKGPLIMNDAEALAFARATIRKLGYSEVDLFTDGEPSRFQKKCLSILPAGQPDSDKYEYDTNFIPYYEIEWKGPRNILGLTIEIDAAHKKVTEMMLGHKPLWAAGPKITVEPPALAPGGAPAFVKTNGILNQQFISIQARTKFTPQQKMDWLLGALPAISDCAKALQLPITLPITTNQIASVDAMTGRLDRVITTNGYEFEYHRGNVNGFKAPHALWHGVFEGNAQYLWGEWNLSKKESIQLARETLTKLGYWKKPYFYDSSPKVEKTEKYGTHTVPRYLISWGSTEMGSALLEIDAGTGTVKSFYVYPP